MMRAGKLRSAVVATAIVMTACALSAVPAGAVTFSNAATITTPDPSCPNMPGPSNVYPSNITVSGVVGLTADVNVVLHGVTHPFEGDLEVLLVGPGGTAARSLVLLSDAGTGGLNTATLTIDDGAAAQVPQNTAWGGGMGTATSTKPTDYKELGADDTYPSAPSPVNHPGPHASSTLASIYNGQSPNGTWSLYVLDDSCSAPDPASTIGGGWSLDITASAGAATSTAVSSSPNPSNTGATVTTTATVTSGGSAVTTGTVSFAEGATTLAANVALNASGQASFTKANFAEGNHVITATYNGTASFATSNGTTNQRVDNLTTVAGSTYCNPGAITIPSVDAATPYPSHIFVTGVAGSVGKVTVQLKNVTHPFAEDVDVLLAGPSTANNLVLVSDAGNGGPATTNVSVTFDDAAASAVPATGAWAAPNASVTYKPVNYDVGGADAFPAPAPVTFASPAPTGAATLAGFASTTANGTWKLYVVDDSGGDAGTIAGGWCLSITALDTTPPATTIARSPAGPNGSGGIYVSDVHVTVAASDAASGVAETRCVLDPASPPANFDVLPASCPYAGGGADVTADGAHTVYAASRDAAGNKGTPVSNSFTIDRTPPAVTVVSAVPDALGASGASTVTWHAGENGAFSIRVGGADCAAGAEVGSGSYGTAPADTTAQVTAAQLAEGANTIRVCVTDSAGNLGSDTTTITKTTPPGDTTPPAVTIDSAAPSLLGSTGASVVTWHASENGAFSVRVGGATCATGTALASGSYATAPAARTTTIPAAALAVGVNVIRVCVTDAANRTGFAATLLGRIALPPSPGPPFSIAKVRAGPRGTVTLTLYCPRPGRLALKLTRKVRVKRPGRSARTITRTYFRGATGVTAAGKLTLKLKPARRTLRSLTPGKRTKISVKVVFTPKNGAASTKTTKVIVRLPKPGRARPLGGGAT